MSVPEKYFEAFERATAELKQACSKKGYIVNLFFEKLKYREDLQGVRVVLENPKTSSRVELFLSAEYEANYDDLNNVVRIFKGGAIRNSDAYIREVIAQIEVLSEELSRTGLGMRDEPAVKKAICMLVAGRPLTTFMWREFSTIVRLCLDYGISLSDYDITSTSENAVKALFEDYVKAYGLDENMKKSIKHILKQYSGEGCSHVIREYFGREEYALYLIGKKELTDDDCKIIEDSLVKAGDRWRMKAIKKIMYRIGQKNGGIAAKKLTKVLTKYLSSSANPNEVVKILKKMTEWFHYYERSPHLVDVCTTALSRLLKIGNISRVEPPPSAKASPPRYFTIYTDEGFKVSVEFESYLGVKVTMYSRLIDEDESYTYFGKSFENGATVEDWGMAQAFVEESMKYFREAFSKARKILQRDEMTLSMTKTCAISGRTLKIAIPKIVMRGTMLKSLGSKEDLVKAFQVKAKEALENISIKFDEVRTKVSHQI